MVYCILFLDFLLIIQALMVRLSTTLGRSPSATVLTEAVIVLSRTTSLPSAPNLTLFLRLSSHQMASFTLRTRPITGVIKDINLLFYDFFNDYGYNIMTLSALYVDDTTNTNSGLKIFDVICQLKNPLEQPNLSFSANGLVINNTKTEQIISTFKEPFMKCRYWFI